MWLIIILVAVGAGAVALSGRKTTSTTPPPIPRPPASFTARVASFTARVAASDVETDVSTAPVVPSSHRTGEINALLRPAGPCALGVWPDRGTIILNDKKSAICEWVPPALNVKEDTRYGGLDIICSNKHFWKTVIKFRPKRRLVEMGYPAIKNIKNTLVGRGKNCGAGTYRISEHYLSDGRTLGDSRSPIWGAYVDPYLTHYMHRAIRDFYIYNYVYDKRSYVCAPGTAYTMVPHRQNSDTEMFSRAQVSAELPAMTLLAANFIKEAYLEHINDWVVFCEGATAGDVGRDGRDSLHSFFVTTYAQTIDTPSWWDSMWRWTDDSVLGGILSAVLSLASGILSIFGGGSFGNSLKPSVSRSIKMIAVEAKELLSSISRVVTDIYGSISAFGGSYIGGMKNYYKYFYDITGGRMPATISYDLDIQKFKMDSIDEYANHYSGELTGLIKATQVEVDDAGRTVNNIDKIRLYVPRR